MMWSARLCLLLLLGSVLAGAGEEKLHVLFENIGREALTLELLQGSGPPQRIGSMVPGQGGKLGTQRGQRYRLSAGSQRPALVEVEDEGHVRCWAAGAEVRVYPIWGPEIFKTQESAEPDPAIMRQEKWEVLFQNRATSAIMLSRVLGSGQRKELGTLPPQKGKRVRCYQGQRFEASSGDLAPTEVRVEGKGSVRISEGAERLSADASWELAEDSGLRKEWLAQAADGRDACERLLARHAADAQHFCHGRFDARPYVWGAFAWAAGPELEPWRQLRREEARRREEAMLQQPARLLRHFTALGHAVRAVPEDVLQPLQRLWREQRLKDSVPEPQSSEVLAESDVWMLYVPDELLDAVHEKLRPVVADWAGVPPGDLVRTDAYGARLYRQGSRLHMHVDSGLRAALSVIVHVGHLGWADGAGEAADAELPEEEAWPLHILDHGGREHRLQTKVGEMILYESATCAHGRPTSFQGREFANVFLHYNPMGWPRAYEREVGGEPRGAEEL